MNRRKALGLLGLAALAPLAAKLGISARPEQVYRGSVVGWLDAGPAPWEGYHSETELRLRYRPGMIVERVACYNVGY